MACNLHLIKITHYQEDKFDQIIIILKKRKQ